MVQHRTAPTVGDGLLDVELGFFQILAPSKYLNMMPPRNFIENIVHVRFVTKLVTKF